MSLVVKILIKLGDAIIFIILSPVKIISRKPLFETPIKLKRKARSGTFKLPVKKKTRKKLVGLFGSFWEWYLARLAAQREKRLAEQRKQVRVKNGIHRPSFFYKLKYVFIGIVFSSVFIFIPLLSFLFV